MTSETTSGGFWNHIHKQKDDILMIPETDSGGIWDHKLKQNNDFFFNEYH